jgi:hypothetical protein
MALMTLKVIPAQGDAVAVPVTPKVIVACERHFKKGMGELFAAGSASYEAMAYAAHQAMLQSGHEVKTFDAWLDGIDEITTEDTPTVPL